MAERSGSLAPKHWDIFCAVVDNYGDVGVCWRLARQLASEHGAHVRLWVDDPVSLSRIATATNFPGIEVHPWKTPFPDTVPAEVVIEAFACELPHAYIAAMAGKDRKPVWINLEYLSAENWVEGCHLGVSRHAVLPLEKVFFFPGFRPRTGGLLRETGLGSDFDAAAFWQSFGLPPAQAGELRISLFGYDNPALESQLEQWAAGAQPVTCLVPQGALAVRTSACMGAGRDNLRLHMFPFLPQEDYDRLLWACDCNFVRGEDSFIRAQWAARPFVWQIYPQQDGAHWPKLEAFLDFYCAGLPVGEAEPVRRFWHAWNGSGVPDWDAFWHQRALLERHNAEWKAGLEKQNDLASNLVTFCKSRV